MSGTQLSQRCRKFRGILIPGCWGGAIWGREHCTCSEDRARVDALDEIATLQQRVSALEKKIKRISAMTEGANMESREFREARVCLKCGRTESGWRYNLCPHCGELADGPYPQTQTDGSLSTPEATNPNQANEQDGERKEQAK